MKPLAGCKVSKRTEWPQQRQIHERIDGKGSLDREVEPEAMRTNRLLGHVHEKFTREKAQGIAPDDPVQIIVIPFHIQDMHESPEAFKPFSAFHISHAFEADDCLSEWWHDRSVNVLANEIVLLVIVLGVEHPEGLVPEIKEERESEEMAEEE